MDLEAILEAHRRWLLGGETPRARADLRRADLQRANLREANLREANLREANLREADLQRANLQWADLREADLRGADLQGADIQEAELRNIRLRGADLRGTSLRGADLRGADLRGADLRGADLDFTCWPLWCGSRNIIVDSRLFRQLAMHLCGVVIDDADPAAAECRAAQAALAPLARGCHVSREFLGLGHEETTEEEVA